MVELFGKNYYIDIDAISEKCEIVTEIKNSNEDSDEKSEKHTEMNIFKYDIIKLCLDRILGEYEEVDEGLGSFSQKDTPTSFRLAFNTLLKYEIIIEEYE